MKLYLASTNELKSIANNIRSTFFINNLLLFPDDFLNSLSEPYNEQVKKLIEGTISGNLIDNTTVNIKNHAFQDCTNLNQIEFTACETIGLLGFGFCKNLTTANLVNCRSLGTYCFVSCLGLKTVSLPRCENVGQAAFSNCVNLCTISLPNCSALQGYAFEGCTKLTSVYLMFNSVVFIDNTTASIANIFALTPILNSNYLSGQYGSIYVPMSLLSEYQAASGWSDIAARIVGI